MTSLRDKFSGEGATPVGAIIPSGVGSPPAGTLACGGQAVSRTGFAALFATIGVTFGPGDGSTTFNVPNTSGLFIRGAGSQVISSKTFNGGAVGNKQKDGTGANGLSMSTVSTPTLSLANADLTHTHGYSDLTTNFTTATNQTEAVGDNQGPSAGYDPFQSSEADSTGSALGLHGHTVTPSITNIVTTLSSTGAETRPAFITLTHYIKY